MDFPQDFNTESKTQSPSILTLALLASVLLHLIVIVCWPPATAPKSAETTKTIKLTLRLNASHKNTVAQAVAVAPKPAASEEQQQSEVVANSEINSAINRAINSSTKKIVAGKKVIGTVGQSSQSLTKLIEKVTSHTSLYADSSIICTSIQRKNPLLNCQQSIPAYDSRRYAVESDLQINIEQALRFPAESSDRAAAINARLLMADSERLSQAYQQASGENYSESEYLQQLVKSDLQALRDRVDSSDRQKSRISVMGVSVDTYRATDSENRNEKIFKRGRL